MGSLGDKLNVIKKLEEEKRKLESCQLDVPLTLQILNDAILDLKEEKKRRSEMQTQPLLKDFIPLNKRIREEDMELLKREELMRENKFQQWKAFDDHILNRRFSDTKIKNNQLDIGRIEERSSMLLIPKVDTGLSLGLASSSIKRNGSVTSCGVTSNSTPQPQPLRQQQASRKQKRKWDDELNGRFFHALQQLGGPGVATPKRIREHMQVEGLTNDEVKSHLQKYRIHIRKPNSNGEKQSGVVLGFELWNSSQEEGGESSNKSSSQSDSPQGPLQLPSTTTTTGGDSSMEDAKSEGFQMERLRSP